MLRIIFFSLFLIFNCKNNPPKLVPPANSTLRLILLRDAETELHIYLPPEMDSSDTWQADCCTGGAPAHAFWDRRFQILKARHGLCFNKFVPDSIRQVTVFHYKALPQDTTTSAWLDRQIDRIIHQQQDAYRRVPFVKFKGVEQWEQGTIAFFAFSGFTTNTPTTDNRQPRETLQMWNKVGDTWVFICFECAGSNCVGFAADMLQYARTMKTSIK
jgi:hypothetical protein